MKIWSERKGIFSISDIRLPSRSRRDCAPLRYYRGSRGNSLPTFRDNLSDLLMGLIGHAEMSEILTTLCVITKKTAVLSFFLDHSVDGFVHGSR